MTTQEYFDLPAAELSRKVAQIQGWSIEFVQQSWVFDNQAKDPRRRSLNDFPLLTDGMRRYNLAYAESLDAIAGAIYGRGWEWCLTESEDDGDPEESFVVGFTVKVATCVFQDQSQLARALCACFCVACEA